jgi:hypothetical protein
MDIRAATSMAAGPWIALAIVLGLASLVLAGLAVALFGRSRRVSVGPVEDTQDDLPGFLDMPPGTPAAGSAAPGGLVALAAPPSPPPAAPERSRRPHAVIAAGAAVLVAAAAVLVAVWAPSASSASSARHPHHADRQPASDSRPARDVQARMTFAGVVLEERAVGVTVTYPEVEFTRNSDGGVAQLTLPTWNCMTAEAPDDPADAGCVRGRTEYAELSSPELETSRADGTLRFSGDFATSTHPTGSAPETTDRVYAIAVEVTPEEALRGRRWTHATGVLELADRRAESVDGEMRAHG